ncbi:hypothetical protein H0G86_008076 [Trichoderma simmonsii]|uniref:Uncharacterized protein n=1 Tax=Trichoderma simmonsii TaxID=1491479 RepID=A0A8G0LHR4_9HYPO|nr:hypothetical protein H0G86_008076 [Trichoderma simmonsii]
MAAADAIQSIAAAEQRVLTEEYGGKLSNKFIDELKAATLFQFDWGELLNAAPTALYFMGSCWLAAANPTAEMISLADVVPEGGFKYMTNLRNPTLRACLVDVCNNGGRQAFTIAGQNMDALHMTSRRICDERIDIVFKRLGPCTASKDALEDFNDALQDLSRDAHRCAELAAETREAFGKWSNMVGELNMCMENQMGNTSIHASGVIQEQHVAEIEEKFAVEASENTKQQVMRAARELEKSEGRLDIALNGVPGPWATVLQGAVVCYTQTIPTIVAGTLPIIFGGGKENKIADLAAQLGFLQGKSPPPQDDPSFARATEIRDLVNHFYSFLGNEKGPIDWEKFKGSPGAGANEIQGLTYFLGTLRGLQQTTDVTGTKANRKLMTVYNTLIKVGTEIQHHLNQQNKINAATNPSEDVVRGWKKEVKKARNVVLNLATQANARSSNSVPRPFGNIKFLGRPDSAAQKAQLNTALQTVQIAQEAVESAQSTYDAALDKQEKTAISMARIQAKLKQLHETGQNLEKIKDVLRDCISVLVDLAVQIRKLEQFFLMLANVIDHIVLPRAETFTREMTKVGRRAQRDGAINADDITKQTIYTSTLQIKGYFSVLQDVSEMYTLVHRKYINEGVDLCYQLSKGTASNDPMFALQERLASYSDKSAQEISTLASNKQAEVLRSLKDRARKALEHTQLIENEVTKRGIAVEESDKLAIKEGGEEHNTEAKSIVDNDVGLTASEQIDSSNF